MIKTKILGVLALMAMGMALISCQPTTGGNSDKNIIDGIDYGSYPTNALITVKNDSINNIVLFKGLPSQKNILGGIKAGSTTTLKKNSSFTTSGDFVVYVVTADDYRKNFANLSVLDGAPYTTFYAVYNDNSKNTDYIYRVSGLLGGTNKIIIDNGTKYNVELRNMGTHGDSLCFSLAGTYNKTYYVDNAAADNDGQVMLFPVFRKYDSNTKEIFDVFPKYQTGKHAGEVKSELIGFDEDNSEFQFNAETWVKGIKFSPSAAYIQITNNADQGLNFFTGANKPAETTSTGGKVINTGKSLLFPIPMTKISEIEYKESETVAGYRLGNKRESEIYLFGTKDKTVTLKGGYIYSFTVSGGMEEDYHVTPDEEEVGAKVKQLKTAKYFDNDGVEHPAEYEEVTVTEKVLKAVPYEF